MRIISFNLFILKMCKSIFLSAKYHGNFLLVIFQTDQAKSFLQVIEFFSNATVTFISSYFASSSMHRENNITEIFDQSFWQILLAIFSAFGGLAALLLLLVPIGRMTVNFPERVIMDLGCEGRNGSLLHTMSQTHPCETKLESEIAIKVESCG